MLQEMFRLTAGIALRALFASRLSAAETEKLRVSLDVFLRGCYFRAFLPVPPNAPLPGNLRYARALNYWRGRVERLIGESRRGAGGDDLMSRLIRPPRRAARGYPAGSIILFSPYILHRWADLFPQPGRFDPDRWLPARLDAEATRRGSFLPFGAGAAKCIGEDFALAETALIVSATVRQWNFRLKPGVTVAAKARAVLTPREFPVYLTRRRGGEQGYPIRAALVSG